MTGAHCEEAPVRTSGELTYPLVLDVERCVHYGNRLAVEPVWVRQSSVASFMNAVVLRAHRAPTIHSPHEERSWGAPVLEAVLGPSCWVICLHSKCKSKLHTPQDLYFHEIEKRKSSCLWRPISIMPFYLIFPSETWPHAPFPSRSHV